MLKMADKNIDRQAYIQSQYSNSPTIKSILNDFSGAINTEESTKIFFDNIFNVETAQGIGLDIWGRIVGIDREISINATLANTALFGFKESDLNPFNNGIFYSEDSDTVTGGNVVLTKLDDTKYRELIMFKALANISPSDMESLKSLTYKIYKTNDVIVSNMLNIGTLSNGDMYNKTPMEVVFIYRKNNITLLERALFEKCLALVLAAGVGYHINVISKDPLFGFAGSGLNPFNNGAFGKYQQINYFGGDTNGNNKRAK